MEVDNSPGDELDKLDKTINSVEGLLRELKRARTAVASRRRHAAKSPNQEIPVTSRPRTDTGNDSDSISDALRRIIKEARELMDVHNSDALELNRTASSLHGKDGNSVGNLGSSEQKDHPADTPTTDAIATEVSATDTPMTDMPTTDTPATDTPATGTTATEIPITGTSAIHTPATDALAIVAPATNPPAVETPAIDPFAVQAPVTDTPATDTPMTDMPTTDTPATDAPTGNTLPSDANNATATDLPALATNPRASATAADAPTNHRSITIQHDFEGKVLVLRPSVDQWLDFPTILASARALGASQVGAFKVVLPPELHHPLPPREETKAKSCYGFHISTLPNKTYSIEILEKRQALRRSLPSEALSIEEAVKRHESQLEDEDGMGGVYYRVDIPAETPQHRAAAGLPEKSAIWPLAGNMLSQTKCSIPGLHWPYMYESGPKFGALFGDHEEHNRLYSISHLKVGRKIWKIIPPAAVDTFVRKLKDTDQEIFWDCEQCVRHAGILVPPSTLTEWGIPFTILDQRAPELVVVFPRAHHSGFSMGYTLAEAVNFADSEWTADPSAACAPICPDNPISIEHLAFLGPGESQRRVEELEEEAAAQERRSTAHHTKKRPGRKLHGIRSNKDGSAGDELASDDGSPRKGLANMPILSPEPIVQITQLIDHVLARQVPPEWLGCADQEAFQARLEQFLPGGCLDDLVLMKVLQVLCRGTGFFVQDPAEIEAGRMVLDEDLLERHHGLVLLIHVGDYDPAASARSRWALLVVDWRVDHLTSVGMDEALANEWKTKIEGLLNVQLHHNSQEVGAGHSSEQDNH